MWTFYSFLPIFYYLLRDAKSYIPSFGLIYGFIVCRGNTFANTFGEAFHIGQEIDSEAEIAFHGFTIFVLSGLGNTIFALVYLPNTIIIGEENCYGIIRHKTERKGIAIFEIWDMQGNVVANMVVRNRGIVYVFLL